MTTREDVLRKAVEGFERDLQDLVYKAPEQWHGWHRAVTASVARALAEADALPSDAERWQQVRERLEVARLHIDETARSLFGLDEYADAVAARSAVMAAWKIAMNGIHGVHSWPTT